MGGPNIILIYLKLGLPTFKMKLSKYSIGNFYKINPSSIRNPVKYLVHFDLSQFFRHEPTTMVLCRP